MPNSCKCILNKALHKGAIMQEERDKVVRKLNGWQWIPCSERLPDKAGRYLTTCSKWGAWEVDWNVWVTEPKPFWLWEQGVIAWMPMPEPYKEGTDDPEE